MNSDLYHPTRVLEVYGVVAKLAVKDARHPFRVTPKERLSTIEFLEACGLMEHCQLDRRVPPCSCRQCWAKRRGAA